MQDFSKFTPNAQSLAGQAVLSGEALFFQRVYAWMFAGLALTAGLGFLLSTSMPWLTFLFQNRPVQWGIFLAQFGLVMYLGNRVQSLSPGAVKGFFLAYAALGGPCFSALFVIYPTYAFVKALICTAGLYGAMALYGFATKRSLQALGGFLFMGLIGLVLAIIVNIFIESGPMDLTICVLGVVIFAGLTAYDHQKLRVMHYSLGRGAGEDLAAEESRTAVMGALTLYLDFINIFLFLLRLFGRRD